MSDTDQFVLGSNVRVTATFGPTGSPANPSAVFFKFKDPSGNVTTYTYGVDLQIVNPSAGVFYVDVDADEAGTFKWRFYSTGTGKAADEGSFEVVDNFS
jgi:hypothetical protein